MRITRVLLGLLIGVAANGQALSPAWVELGPEGRALVRIVVNSPQDCPAIQLDATSSKMMLRQPIPAGIQPACEFAIPPSVKSASVNGQRLVLPSSNPKRIVVIGDTGCRVKGDRVQACNDPAEWPFAEVSSNAAAEKPDLIIHVGDYLYRESPCPADSANRCGGTPNGDNWGAWNADFFTPAAKLLAAAPWAFSRGNHETCSRSWRGWFYYLDPRPLEPNWLENCQTYSRPYVTSLGKFQLAMLDSAPVLEDKAEEKQVNEYVQQLAFFKDNLHGPEPAWLVDHHPFWAMKADGTSKPLPISAPLEEAWDRAAPKNIGLILSGHVHLFELLSFDHKRPTQIVAGDAGTDLADPIKTTTKGVVIDSATVLSGESQHQFGYTVMTRASRRSPWELTLKNRARNVLLRCSLQKNQATCSTTPLAASE